MWQIELFQDAALRRGTPSAPTHAGQALGSFGAPAPGTDAEGDRVAVVWRQWLASMATDAEAALAAAIAYRDMDSAGRETWLDSLPRDAAEIRVPPIALYAPLLSVEDEPSRRERMFLALGADGTLQTSRLRPFALLGKRPGGLETYVLVLPLYLDFVQVLACHVRAGAFEWVRHEPILRAVDAPQPGSVVEGVRLERTPMTTSVDSLAAVVLSHRRLGRALPDALQILVDLLTTDQA